MMYTDGAQCTANFVYTDGAGKTYVGYAAHCAGTGAATDTNGCDAQSLPLGTKVDFIEGGTLVSEGTRVGTGTLVYSSWLTMQQKGETDENTCAYNDLALVKVDAADVSKVNPSMPFWGGPIGHRHQRHRRRRHASTPTATPASAAASSPSRRTPAPASATDGGRLVAPRLHRDPGHPR